MCKRALVVMMVIMGMIMMITIIAVLDEYFDKPQCICNEFKTQFLQLSCREPDERGATYGIEKKPSRHTRHYHVRQKLSGKEDEKVDKYRNLAMTRNALWKMKMVKIFPVVIGCLGTIPKRLEWNLKEIGIRMSTTLMQKTVLLGSERIRIKRMSTGSSSRSTCRFFSSPYTSLGS